MITLSLITTCYKTHEPQTLNNNQHELSHWSPYLSYQICIHFLCCTLLNKPANKNWQRNSADNCTLNNMLTYLKMSLQTCQMLVWSLPFKIPVSNMLSVRDLQIECLVYFVSYCYSYPASSCQSNTDADTLFQTGGIKRTISDVSFNYLFSFL